MSTRSNFLDLRIYIVPGTYRRDVNPSEVRLLRDELARVIAGVKKGDRILERQGVQIKQLEGQLGKGGGRVTYYENPHSPPSANSIPARQRKKASRKDPAAHKKSGQRPGRRDGHSQEDPVQDSPQERR